MDSQQSLSFYMGKNTPERKDDIMQNPVVTVEEWGRGKSFYFVPLLDAWKTYRTFPARKVSSG